MTPEARQLFVKSAAEQDPWLWDYVLLRDGKNVLMVTDQTKRMVAESFIQECLQKLFTTWFKLVGELKPRKEETPSENREKVLEALMETMKDSLLKYSAKKKPE